MEGFSPGRAEQAPEESCHRSFFFFFQTTGKRRSLSSFVFLFLALLHFFLYLPVPLVKIFTFSVPVMPLSAWLCKINRRVSEDETAKRPPGAGPVVMLTLPPSPPEDHSSHPAMLAESNTETGSWTEVKDAPCVLPEGEMSIYTTGMFPATPPNPLFPDTSLSPTHCRCRLCADKSLRRASESLVKVETQEGLIEERRGWRTSQEKRWRGGW